MRAIATKQPTNESAKQRKSGDKGRSHSISPLSTGMPLLQPKCACGGGCPRCQEELGIQTKLKISEPGDRYEQEADRIADEVMRMPEPSVQRQIEPEEEEQEMVQRKAIGDRVSPLEQKQGSSEETPIIHEVLNSHSQPLDSGTRSFMEPRFVHDFSRIRIHTDEQASKTARCLNARALTIGNHIAFNHGEFNTGNSVSRKLLAHELAHTVQQRHSPAIQLAPIPSSATNPPPVGVPNLGVATPRETKTPKEDVCPDCICDSQQEEQLEKARDKAVKLFNHAASQLNATNKRTDAMFEQSFGIGSATPDNIEQVSKIIQGAASFLNNSKIGENIHCDDATQPVTGNCQRGVTGFWEKGHIIVCSGHKAAQPLLNPPSVKPVYKPNKSGDEPVEIDVKSTQQSQAESDQKFNARLTFLIAHEAVHDRIPNSRVDVYTNERLFQFLGSQNPLGVNLTAIAINNPDSIVTFAFQTLELEAGQSIVPESSAALSKSEKLSGDLGIRPLRGRKKAIAAIAIAQEVIENVEKDVSDLHSYVQSVQNKKSDWTLFPPMFRDLVQMLTDYENAKAFSHPDASAEARLRQIVDGLQQIEEGMKTKRTVIARRFLRSRPEHRNEITISNWHDFRKKSAADQIFVLLEALLEGDSRVGHLARFMWEYARKYGYMGQGKND